MNWEAQKDYRTGYTRDDWKQPPLYAIVEQDGLSSYRWRVTRNLEAPNARGENWETIAKGDTDNRAIAKREAKAALIAARTPADKTFSLRWFGS